MDAWLAEGRFYLQDPSRFIDRVMRWMDDIRPSTALSWIFTATAAIPVALLIGVPTSGVGIGLVIGTMIAAGIAWHAHRQARRNAEDIARIIREVHADADRRVELVTRQYEWAVNDVANLRDALRRAQTRPSGERWAKDLKRQAQPIRHIAVPLSSAIFAQGSLTSVRFEARETVPAQVRIVDERGTVVAISARNVEPGNTTFVLRISERTADALVHHDGSGLRVEALVDETWQAADLRAPADRSSELAPADHDRPLSDSPLFDQPI